MFNGTPLPGGYETGTQSPLDQKGKFFGLDDLTDLSNDRPFKWYKNMKCIDVLTGKEYIWRESDHGILDVGYTYPTGISSFNISYSGRTFNFVEIESKEKNCYTLSSNFIENGFFTVNSLDLNELTTISVNRKNNNNRIQFEFFNFLNNNKEYALLKIVDEFNIVQVILSVNNITFNSDSFILSVSVFSNLKLYSLFISKDYTFEVSLERAVDFTISEINSLKDLVYTKFTQYINVTPTSFEKGTKPAFEFKWRVTANDDTLTSSEIGGVSVINDADGTEQTINVDGGVNTQLVDRVLTLVTTVTENDVDGGSITKTNTATSYARIPQFTGKTSLNPSNFEDISYSFLTDNFDKHIQSSASINFTKTYSGEKAWILSIKNNATIKDGNDFALSIGGQFDSTFWILREVTFLLESGTVQTGYLYISRENLNGTFTFKIS